MLLEEVLALQRQLDDKPSIAAVLTNLALVARDQGDQTRARMLLREALTIVRELGTIRGIASVLDILGAVLTEQDETEHARTVLREALSLYQTMGDDDGIAVIVGRLGNLAQKQEDLAHAAALLGISLRLERQCGLVPVEEFFSSPAVSGSVTHLPILGRLPVSAEVLEALAQSMAAQGHMVEAAHLLGAAAVLRRKWSTPVPPRWRDTNERTIRRVSEALREDIASAAWKYGLELGLDDNITVIASCRSWVRSWTLLLLEDSRDRRRAHGRRFDCNDLRGD